ncbi:MAG TPA: hypothetical protein VGR24_03075 [bacterium]|jgi:hypothetical protein|nr:hypothetical protein [bacterium]
MPVTAKLSRAFYERFGDDLTNELVDWFNKVDATYRLEFRDLFDTNFARFDAKLEQRVAELRAELRQEMAELRSEFQSGQALLEGRLLARIGVLEGRFGTLEGRLVRWMFLFWAASLGTVVALR